MNKNILKDDLIAPQKLHIVLLTLFAALSIWMLWEGFNQYAAINHFLDTPTVEAGSDNMTLAIGDILLSRMAVVANDSSKTMEVKWYASVLKLDHQTPDAKKRALAENHHITKQPVYGLAGAPSFIIKPADISFWRWQLYLELLVNFGGGLLLSLSYIIIYEFNYREDKLFITPIKNTVLAAGVLLILGAIIKWGLSFRLVHFLNSHFYIHSLDAHYPFYLIYIATPIIILGVWLDQAVRLQKEHDLTI